MLERLKRWLTFVVDPPWTRDGPENFTLAVSEAHSTFKRGDVGWPSRPPAVVECPSCGRPFIHEFANDFVDCPHCQFGCAPDEFADLELRTLICPHCDEALDHGTRHPGMMEVPEWASCTDCQYHWEYQHDYDG
jgi:Zn finger protein HypA/HybF involved in hydrogenase expression